MNGQIEALSALDWWREAGVDTLVDEEPRDWLRAPPKPEIIAPVMPVADALPETLAGFHVWWRETEALPGAPTSRLMPAGNPVSGLMLLADMPDATDAIFSGEIGRLFDRMMAAVGRDRTSIYLAAMAGVRVAARGLEDETLVRAAKHHVALAVPRLLLLLGEAPSRAILGMGFAEARGRIHEFNHDGATVRAIATFHPRFLLQRPALKAAAWADLRMLIGELGV
jgi:uracil-DNA glycosylase family 4